MELLHALLGQHLTLLSDHSTSFPVRGQLAANQCVH